MASKGIVNSAMTRIEATVRNFAYIGTWSMKKSVSPMKFLPHESIIERIVATSRAHFIGPFTTSSANTNNISTKAPT